MCERIEKGDAFEGSIRTEIFAEHVRHLVATGRGPDLRVEQASLARWSRHNELSVSLEWGNVGRVIFSPTYNRGDAAR